MFKHKASKAREIRLFMKARGSALLVGLVGGFSFAEEAIPGIGAELPEPGVVESLPEVKPVGVGGDRRGQMLAENFSKVRIESWEGAGDLESVSPFLAVDRDLIVPAPEALSRRLEDLVGGGLDEAALLEVVDLILVHYDRHGYPVVGVDAPQQDFADGVLTLYVEIGRIGRVGVTRPRYGRDELIRRGLFLRDGEILERSDLDRQLDWFGRTAFRRPRLFVTPGEAPATADILIGLEESRPWRASLGYENSGPDLAGRERLLVGFAGMTPGEHVVAWQTVLGLPVSSLHAHSVSWEIPLHQWRQTLQLDAAYAEIENRTPSALGILNNEGSSWSLSLTHRSILPRLGRWRQQLVSGVEVKGTDQFVLFGGGGFAPGEVRMVHGKVSYGLERRWDDAGLAFGASLIGSPGGVIPGNDDADFRAYDPMAGSEYVIGRLNGQGWWSPGGDWRIGLRGSAQWADSRLLPSEQFAAGGHRSVRGIGERAFIADGGWQASLELVSPEWSAGNWMRVRGIGFFDHAWLKNRGGPSSSVSGAGLGMRMRLTDYIDVRADHGWWLDGRGSRTHFGVTMRY